MSEPLRMIVLGDSIAWGQGLAEPEKFSTRVQVWLAGEIRRDVTREVRAHSRAVIAPDDLEDRQPPRPGEVPSRHPSITAQARGVPRPDEVDLILLDGGINDMGAQQIVNPVRAFDPGWIREQARVHCGRMGALLASEILPRYPRARVVVTGYYPLLSAQSDLLQVLPVLRLAWAEGAEVARLVGGAAIGPLVRQSSAWAEASDDALRRAVAEANGGAALTPGAGRAVFVPVPFGPERCYGAPGTWLWRLGEEDSVRAERLPQCLEFAFGDPLCPFEPAFHPNRAGAEAYAEAITAALRPLLPRWTR